MTLTEWYEPHQKPVRVGYFEISTFDAGWSYECMFWFDGEVWRNEEHGYRLWDQNLTWRGLSEGPNDE